jgi:hypothetical protein
MSNLNKASDLFNRTLASETFSNEDKVVDIVKEQIHKSGLAGVQKEESKQNVGSDHSDEEVQYWAGKVWEFLEELRRACPELNRKKKASGRIPEWKLKDETERYRVMYKEGPEGSPFHTLGLDGLVDGDFTSALCVAWEVPLYKEWWPHFKVPTFKVVESKLLKRIRVGHDLELIRFKIPWPLADREVVWSAFEIHDLEQEILVGLIESVPEAIGELNEKVVGFTAADVPPSAATNVRMDVRGGFVMQRISKDQFFFRTLINMDMKLEYVPPSLINFISRHVAGQGLKLYQKAVLAACKGTGKGQAFEKPLKTGLLYDRVKSGLEMKTRATG